MKIIRLTDQQRREITERRRQAQDRRIYQRLSAVLWCDAGRTREEVAELLGVSARQVGDWLRIFRNKGLDELCTLHYRGESRSAVARPGRAAPTGDRHGGLPQRRPSAGLDRGALRRRLLRHRGEGPAAPDRGQLPQGLRLFSGRRTGTSSVDSSASIGGNGARPGRGPAATSWPPATRSGAWTCSTAAGCWSASGTTAASAMAASG